VVRAKVTKTPIVRRVMVGSYGHGCVGAFYAPCPKEGKHILQIHRSKTVEKCCGYTNVYGWRSRPEAEAQIPGRAYYSSGHKSLTLVSWFRTHGWRTAPGNRSMR